MHLYPLSDQMQEALAGLESLFTQAPWWQVVLVVAAAPAVCEELAFRGFIFTGLRNTGSRWRAIGASAVFFGLSHGILQQSLIASLIGVLLGWLALRTGSILPGMAFHLVHNALGVLASRAPRALESEWPILGSLIQRTDEGVAFSWPVVLAGGLAGLVILAWLSRDTSAVPQEREGGQESFSMSAMKG
jgi:sodium transport system permease protein